ncbi:Tn3 family transposase [Palleronia caenipelagi]|nr:Tn3 family transposase [Palleronia caenipelagi]
MEQLWSAEALRAHWVLSPEELELLKRMSLRRGLVLGYYLKSFQRYARFPRLSDPVPEAVADFLGEQLGYRGPLPSHVPDRTDRHYRRLVSHHLRLRRFDRAASGEFVEWFMAEVLPSAPQVSAFDERMTAWFLANRFIRPDQSRLDKLVAQSERQFDHRQYATISGRLALAHKHALDALLTTDEAASRFAQLARGPAGASVQAVQDAVARLEMVRAIGLPTHLMEGVHPDHIAGLARRAASEDAWDMRRRPEVVRHALLSCFCAIRATELTDDLGDLVISIIHKISARAESKVIKEYVADFRKAESKDTVLGKIVLAVDGQPEGDIPQVIYPVVSRETIRELAQSYQADTPSFTTRVHHTIRRSYARHYRRVLPVILRALTFRTSSASAEPLLEALAILTEPSDRKSQFYAESEVPFDGVIRPKWRDIVLEMGPGGVSRVNRINYEICVLQTLRDKLRTKEIWIEGAKQYCDPDQDLPPDFDTRREHYCDLLDQPQSAAQFVQALRNSMKEGLIAFDQGFPANKDVTFKSRAGGTRLSLRPLSPQTDPVGLEDLKAELARRWPMTSLLDVLKEVDLRTEFTPLFRAAGSRQTLPQEEVSRRLLLALFGIGTNIGLKAIAAGPHKVSYKELLYIRQRFIHKTALQDATRRIADATYRIRSADIWGDAGTSCASDSTQLASWDQNLMTEWHQRYGGRGVMIYWHVDKQATCVHSQLKQVSSSEVASMIEGVLHHGTDLDIDRQFVDTHGQSVVGFAFCHLLGFDLMPRLKGIASQKIARADKQADHRFANIEPICTARPIDWDLIARHYDEMIRLASALKLRTADAETILRRFTRGQTHPVFSALLELGKAVKTIFLCRYLGNAELRREIHSGLNVIERWNGVNDFIFYGNGNELVSNRRDDHEISVLSLHLLQAAMVYVNTLMIQQVLRERSWREKMTNRDMAALNPLPHGHFNPYGVFDLDMDARLPLEEMRMAA